MNTLNDAITRVDEIAIRLGNVQNFADIDARISLDNDLKHLLIVDEPAFKHKIKKLLASKYNSEIANYLIPAKKRGTKVGEKNIWSPMGENLTVFLNGKNLFGGVNLLDTTVAMWTNEAVKKASEAIIEYYENPHSKANYLSTFRKVLKALGVANEIIAHSAQPEITREHNEKMANRQLELIETGVDLPDAYKNIDDLISRIDAYLASNEKPNGQVAADLLVALSARPSESETLKVGEHGKVSGVLKKKSDDLTKEYNLITAVGIDRAEAFLNKWRGLLQEDRTAAMSQLKKLVNVMGIQRRHLRMIGAHLATKEARKLGVIKNDAQERLYHAEALRHEPHKMAAQDHYTKINDSPTSSQPISEIPEEFDESDGSNSELIAKFNTLSAGDRAIVIALIYRLSGSQ